MADRITWQIFESDNDTVSARITVAGRVILESTNLFDIGTRPQLYDDYYPSFIIRVPETTVALFWAYLLNQDDEGLDHLSIPTLQIYDLIAFQNENIKPYDQLMNKFRAWFIKSWEIKKINQKGMIDIHGGISKKWTTDLLHATVLAAKLRAPTIFHSASYQWFLHSKGNQTTAAFHLRLDLEYLRPALTNLMAARTGFAEKLAAYLSYDRKKDGQARSKNCPSEACAAKRTFSYYLALEKTDLWPVAHATAQNSIYQILEGLKKFDYVPIDEASSIYPPDASRQVNLQADKDRSIVADPECGCNPAEFKRLIDKKVHGAFNALLCKWNKDGSKDNFSGLCLDCVLNTKGVDVDEQYWTLVDNDVAGLGVGNGCSVKHGQPDWYYSFMGREEDLRTYDKNRDDKFQILGNLLGALGH